MLSVAQAHIHTLRYIEIAYDSEPTSCSLPDGTLVVHSF